MSSQIMNKALPIMMRVSALTCNTNKYNFLSVDSLRFTFCFPAFLVYLQSFFYNNCSNIRYHRQLFLGQC